MTNTDNRILGYGVAGSLAMHVLLFIALAVFMGMGPVNKITRSIPEPEPVVTMVFPQDIKEMSSQEIPKPKTGTENYIRTTQNENASSAPTTADFISDRNTVASAKLAPDPTGVAGRPTLNGLNIPTTELANREYIDGQITNDRALPPPQEIHPAEVLTEPAPEMKTPDELPTLGTAPMPPQLADNSPQTFTSAMKGSVRNRGNEDAVNAVATATGRYKSRVNAAIEKKWKQILVQKNYMVDPGKLGLNFFVDRNGKVNPDDLLIVFNEANAELTEIARQSILEAEIPPIPEDLLLTLGQGRFGTEYDAVLLEAKNAHAGQ